MYRKSVITVWVVAFCTQAMGMSFVGGLLQYSDYESSIPCTSETEKSCQSVKGSLGYALDQASQAGLEISRVVEKPGVSQQDPQVFVSTQKYGVCRVALKNEEKLGPMGFICKGAGLKSKNSQKLDRVFSLTKNENEQYALEDVTQSAKLGSEL